MYGYGTIVDFADVVVDKIYWDGKIMENIEEEAEDFWAKVGFYDIEDIEIGDFMISIEEETE